MSAIAPQNSPLISIIMPVYETPIAQVARMVASITGQDYSNFELLVVDDGSSKGYVAELADLVSSDERIRLLSASHGGASQARNVGIDQARGDFLMFVDSDDELMEGCLTEVMSLTIEHDLDVVCGAVEYVFADCAEFSSTRLPDFTLVEGDDLTLLSRYFFAHEGMAERPEWTGIPRGPIAKLFSRKTINDVRFDPAFIMYEDGIFVSLVVRNARRVGLTSRCWYRYFQNASSLMYSLKFDERFEAHAKRLAEVVESEAISRNDYYAQICYYYQDALEQETLAGNRGILSRMKEYGALPFCQEAFAELDESEYDLTSKRKLIHKLCRSNAYSLVYLLYRLRARKRQASGRRAIGRES